MVAVGVREAKAHLSAYLQRAARGDEVLITDRGKPLALLIGAAQRGRSSRGGLAALAQQGLAEFPRAGRNLRPARCGNTGGKLVSDLVLESRR